MTHAARERLQVSAPIFFASTAAWILLVIKGARAPVCHAQMPDAASVKRLFPLAGSDFLTSFTAAWALMLASMMLPMLTAPVRHIRNRTFARQRVRAIALFLSGYATVWMIAGAGLALLAATARSHAGEILALTAATTAALLWEFSPAKQTCLNRCHVGVELDVFGIAANWSALRFGLIHGKWCIGSCWLLMLLPWMVVRNHLLIMAVVMLWLFAERLDPPMRPRWRWRVPVKAFRIAFAQARRPLVGTRRAAIQSQ
jgi:predicted metal-binding membrane protein